MCNIYGAIEESRNDKNTCAIEDSRVRLNTSVLSADHTFADSHFDQGGVT